MAGADTSILVNSPSISVFTDNVVHVLGSRADVTWQSSNDFGFFTRSQLQLDSPNANLSVTAPNGGSVDDSALIHASGNANITLQGDGSARTTALADQASIVVDGSGRIDLSNTNRDVSLGPSSQLRLGSGNISLTSTNANVVALPNAAILVDGAGNVTASAPAGRVDFRTGSNITASSPGNRIVFSANGDIFVPTLAATDVNITSSNGALNFLAGSLGVAVVAFNVLVNGRVGAGDANAGFDCPIWPVGGKGLEEVAPIFQHVIEAVDLEADLWPQPTVLMLDAQVVEIIGQRIEQAGSRHGSL